MCIRDSFTPLSADESGVVVVGDGNGLAIADIDNDGDQDALFAINNGSFRLLKNQSDSPSVRVKVRGVPANSEGIGTRFVFRSEDNEAQQAFEISAGSSYLSQSSATPSIALKTLEKSSSVDVFWPDGTKSSFEDLAPEKGRLILRYP